MIPTIILTLFGLFVWYTLKRSSNGIKNYSPHLDNYYLLKQAMCHYKNNGYMPLSYDYTCRNDAYTTTMYGDNSGQYSLTPFLDIHKHILDKEIYNHKRWLSYENDVFLQNDMEWRYGKKK